MEEEATDALEVAEKADEERETQKASEEMSRNIYKPLEFPE
jgi:hypothetical protein